MGPGFCPEFGCRALPALSVWQGSGFAADQTNAMLATSNGGDKNSRKRKPSAPIGNNGLRRGIFHLRQRNEMFLHPVFKGLFPLHTVLFWHFCMMGGITTLGVRFMPLKRWTRRSYGGVFVVFMPPRCSPCAG